PLPGRTWYVSSRRRSVGGGTRRVARVVWRVAGLTCAVARAPSARVPCRSGCYRRPSCTLYFLLPTSGVHDVQSFSRSCFHEHAGRDKSASEGSRTGHFRAANLSSLCAQPRTRVLDCGRVEIPNLCRRERPTKSGHPLFPLLVTDH